MLQSNKSMSAVTVIPDDDDEFYANYDLDAAVAQAKSHSKGQSLAVRSQLRTTLFDLFGYSEVKSTSPIMATEQRSNSN